MARARQAIPVRATAPVHIHWKKITTYKATYRAKGKNGKVNELIVHSVRRPPTEKVFHVAAGRRKFKLAKLTIDKRTILIMAKTKTRKKPVEQEELEEIEALEELEELEDEEEEDEDAEDDDSEDEEDDEDEDEPEDEEEEDEDEEDEEPAPKRSKKSAKSKSTTKSNSKAPKSRAAAEGKVGTQEVAAAAGIDGRALRIMLRKHGIPTDEDSGRYQWTSLNHPQVKKILQLVKQGAHKKAAQEGLDKLKAKKAAGSTKATKTSTKTKGTTTAKKKRRSA